MFAAEKQEVTILTETTPRSLMSESMYKLFWEKVTKIVASLGVLLSLNYHVKEKSQGYVMWKLVVSQALRKIITSKSTSKL